MVVTPVKKYASPCIPTILEIRDHPELLKRLPRRWRTKPLVMAALAGSSVFMSGCNLQDWLDRLGYPPLTGLIEPPYYLAENQAGEVAQARLAAEPQVAVKAVAVEQMTPEQVRQQMLEYLGWLEGQGII